MVGSLRPIRVPDGDSPRGKRADASLVEPDAPGDRSASGDVGTVGIADAARRDLALAESRSTGACSGA
ncbi:hypothetical protein [Mycetocola reblochoni]|uniref:hypothetical protein n=1 Tax=Mycetocola reblochoni TaxID=331618 RepID=UPI0015C6570E|nr:hypothetical protein [Mycetocola reblochoni]